MDTEPGSVFQYDEKGTIGKVWPYRIEELRCLHTSLSLCLDEEVSRE